MSCPKSRRFAALRARDAGTAPSPAVRRRPGALLDPSTFLAFNVAPTEEMILIGFKMTPWHSLALIAASLVLLHALVFAVGFAGLGTGTRRLWVRQALSRLHPARLRHRAARQPLCAVDLRPGRWRRSERRRSHRHGTRIPVGDRGRDRAAGDMREDGRG